MRICKRCHIEKPLAEFYERGGGYGSHGYSSWCRPCSRSYVLAWRAKPKNRIKRRAHQLVAQALKNGLLKRGTVCATCGEETRVSAHHEQYKLPLVVVWLCDSCHVKRHWVLRRALPRRGRTQKAAARDNGKLGGRPKGPGRLPPPGMERKLNEIRTLRLETTRPPHPPLS